MHPSFRVTALRRLSASSLSKRAGALQSALIKWFRANRRDLPWRRTRDAYPIWVSEIMLQQTRVDTVVPYYHAFLKRFPSVHTLADAPLEHVLEAWSGLGYYRRARMLHRGAQHVVQHHGGELPREPERLLEVPGIGEYTAGAVASIAFSVPAALVDGNVHRVLARIFGIGLPEAETRKQVWELARALVPQRDPGDFNQALMELGATICTPSSPGCLVCPVRSQCEAQRQGKTAEWPLPKARKAVPTKTTSAYVLVTAKGAVLLARRKEEGRFGGLWEPPQLEDPPEWAKQLREVAQITHILTHERMNVRVFVGAVGRIKAPKLPPYVETRLVPEGEVEGMALSKLARKVLAWREA